MTEKEAYDLAVSVDSGCMCGRFESCERCSPWSTLNKQSTLIRKIPQVREMLDKRRIRKGYREIRDEIHVLSVKFFVKKAGMYSRKYVEELTLAVLSKDEG